ncbi:hypothetical protein E3226_010130 [Legionella geestiana]|uniref:hypothetical protein n=1 Tax=Legionella geestiana TaxID=45065 RepID=UPI001091AFB5|nr:hypothetical protein [Legionella geestiana]QDQ40727.1 hypothetical protein E3226_010130 [Legionella geestiana]
MFFVQSVVGGILLILCAMNTVRAEETDQFTLPPQALADTGPAGSEALFRVIERAAAHTNQQMAHLEQAEPHSRTAAKALLQYQRGAHFADAVYRATGPGFPRWMRWNRLPVTALPKFYSESCPWNNVYWLAFSQSPLSLMGLAPTVNMYGHYFGTDKLGHFFMMGHTYYTLYRHARSRGKSAAQAHALLVRYGEFLEKTYLGMLVNGVYSNGDLSANYAGWKFYSNLTRPVKIGHETLSPILVLRNNRWEFSERVTPSNLLKPYLNDNLNEAFNPCYYLFSRGQIRREIKKRCANWKERRGLTREMVQAKHEETRLWNGENYGHWLPSGSAVTLQACFENR